MRRARADGLAATHCDAAGRAATRRTRVGRCLTCDRASRSMRWACQTRATARVAAYAGRVRRRRPRESQACTGCVQRWRNAHATKRRRTAAESAPRGCDWDALATRRPRQTSTERQRTLRDPSNATSRETNSTWQARSADRRHRSRHDPATTAARHPHPAQTTPACHPA